MEITRPRCTFCGVQRWTVAAMRPCTTPTTFHSWTEDAGRQRTLWEEKLASLDVVLTAFELSPERFSRALQITWKEK